MLKIYGGLRRENYILFFGRIVTRFGSMIWSMMTLILNQKLGFNASQVSLFMVIYSIVSMLGGLAGGKLADKYSKKNCIIVCDCVSVLIYLTCAFVELSVYSIGLIVIAGTAQWMERPMYNALIADITKPEEREKAYALQYLGVNLGMMFAPTLAGFLFKKHLSLLFAICGISIGISTLLIYFFVKNVEAEKITNARELRRDGDSLFKVLWGDKILLAYICVMGLYSAVYRQYEYLMPLDMGAMYGEDGAVLFGTVCSTNCIIVVIFSPLVLKLCNGIRPKHKIITAQFFIAAGYVLYLSFIRYIPAYYAAMILFTFGEIFEALGNSPLITAHSPASHRGRINGFREVLSSSCDSLMLLASGALYDRHGSGASWTLVLTVIGCVIVCTAVLNAKTTRLRKRGEADV